MLMNVICSSSILRLTVTMTTLRKIEKCGLWSYYAFGVFASKSPDSHDIHEPYTMTWGRNRPAVNDFDASAVDIRLYALDIWYIQLVM